MPGTHPPISEARRRLLNRMGIDVWHLRGTAAGSSVESAGGVADTAGRVPEQVAAGSSVTPAAPARSVAKGGATQAVAMDALSAAAAPGEVAVPETVDVPGEVAAPGAVDVPGAVAPGTADEAPFAVQALGLPGVLLVASAFSRRHEQALARDVLRAARRDWSATVEQARFDWPQPGAAGKSNSALAAFVEKQAENCAAQLVLVAESTVPRLGNCPFKFVEVPDMSSLADPRNKQALWRRLQALAL